MVIPVQKPKKLPRDSNALAARIVAMSTGEPPPKLLPVQKKAAASTPELPVQKNPAAVSLGRLGGLKGGKARAAALSKKKRAEIARLAAAARWKKS
jgi:hypothetical protein